MNFRLLSMTARRQRPVPDLIPDLMRLRYESDRTGCHSARAHGQEANDVLQAIRGGSRQGCDRVL